MGKVTGINLREVVVGIDFELKDWGKFHTDVTLIRNENEEWEYKSRTKETIFSDVDVESWITSVARTKALAHIYRYRKIV